MFLASLLRRRALLIGLFVLGGTALAMLVGSTVSTLYTARVLMAIERREPAPITADTPMRPDPTDLGFVRAEMKVLTSHDFAEEVVGALQLTDDPEFQPSPPSFLQRRLAQIKGWAYALPASFGTDQSPASVGSTTTVPDPALTAVRLFQRRLEVRLEEDSRVVTVAFTADNPEKSARIVQAVAELYLVRQAGDKRGEVTRTADLLRERMHGLHDEVERAEAAAQTYRAQHGLAPTGGTDIVDQQVADVSRELMVARADLVRRESGLAAVRANRGKDLLPAGVDATVVTDLRRQESELLRREAELRVTLGDRHPQLRLVQGELAEIVTKIRQEMGRVVASVESETSAARERMATLESELAALLQARDRSNEAALQATELERKAAAARRLYEVFLLRAKEAGEREAIVLPDARIIASANAPELPSTPGLDTFAVMGFITSTIAGLLAALLRDRLDDRMRDAGEVRRVLGLPCIAMVPHLARQALRTERQRMAMLEAYVEAMRSTLAALHVGSEGRPRLMLVTSALEGEGRTTLAASLAAYAARLGRRVLLINLDGRRPAGMGRPEEVGLVDRLLGDLPFDDLIRRDDALRIDFIASGRQRGDLVGLAMSGELRQMLGRLGGCYDLVVIDGPPVLGAADARILAPLVDRILLVVRAGSTRGRQVSEAITHLREVGAGVVGVVLTEAHVRMPRRQRSRTTVESPAAGDTSPGEQITPATPAPLAAATPWSRFGTRMRRAGASLDATALARSSS